MEGRNDYANDLNWNRSALIYFETSLKDNAQTITSCYQELDNGKTTAPRLLTRENTINNNHTAHEIRHQWPWQHQLSQQDMLLLFEKVQSVKNEVDALKSTITFTEGGLNKKIQKTTQITNELIHNLANETFCEITTQIYQLK